MSAALSIAACLGIGYVFGSLPFGLWLGRWFRGVDVRTLGSMNLGATNVFRSLGRGLGVATLLLDVAKGALPVWLVPHLGVAAGVPGGPQVAVLVAGLGAIAGHVWTFLAGFKGGKGVATTAGVLLAVSPPALLAGVTVFAVTVGISRYISLGSILAAIAFATTLALTGDPARRAVMTAFGAVVALLVIARHRGNILRLLAGTERRFEWGRRGNA